MIHWMTFYQKKMTSETILNGGKTLEQEIKEFDEYIDEPNTKRAITVDDRIRLAKISKIRKELYGNIEIENISMLYFEESARISLGVSVDEWENYDIEQKGKMLAVSSMKNKLETIERFHSIRDRENRNASKS